MASCFNPPLYHPLEFLFKTLSDKHEDICWTSFSHADTHARIESYWCASKYQRDPLWSCYPSQLWAIWFLGPNKSWKILSVCNNVTLVSDWKWRNKMALDRVFDPLSQVSQIITSLQNCPQSQLPQSQLPQSASVSEKTSQSKAQDHNLHHLDYMPQTIFEPNFGNQSITPAQTSFHCALCSTFFAPD